MTNLITLLFGVWFSLFVYTVGEEPPPEWGLVLGQVHCHNAEYQHVWVGDECDQAMCRFTTGETYVFNVCRYKGASCVSYGSKHCSDPTEITF